jgi:hypothetical protein
MTVRAIEHVGITVPDMDAPRGRRGNAAQRAR